VSSVVVATLCLSEAELGLLNASVTQSYSFSASYSGSGNYLPEESEPVTVSVSAAALLLTALPQTSTYGSSVLGFNQSDYNVSGLMLNQSLLDVFSEVPQVTTGASLGSAADKYVISFVSGDALLGPNYVVTFQNSTFTIAPATSSVSVFVSPTSSAYTYGSPVTLSAVVCSTGVSSSVGVSATGSVQFSLDSYSSSFGAPVRTATVGCGVGVGGCAVCSVFSLALDPSNSSDALLLARLTVGSHSFLAEYSGDKNYTSSNTTTATSLTVSAAQLVLTALPLSSVYGSDLVPVLGESPLALPELGTDYSVSGLQLSDDFLDVFSGVPTLTSAVTSVSSVSSVSSVVGSGYDIDISKGNLSCLASVCNYNLSVYEKGTYTLYPATPTVRVSVSVASGSTPSWEAAGEAASLTYGGNLSVRVVVVGVSTAGASVPQGEVSVYVSGSSFGLLNGSLTSESASSSDCSGASPGSDSVACGVFVLPLSEAELASLASNASYVISASYEPPSASNYSMSSSSGVGGSSANVSVSPASLTFSAVNASSVFGSEAAVLNYTVSGFVFGQTLSQLYSGSPSLSSPGETPDAIADFYPITITSGNLTCKAAVVCNYDLVFSNATYSVLPGDFSCILVCLSCFLVNIDLVVY
jgi:hypothetical protein